VSYGMMQAFLYMKLFLR